MIYLLRHGADDDTRLGGWSDAGLSPLGVEQVQKSGEFIAGGCFNICRICSSDLPRAKETAEIIAEKLGLHVALVRDFRETNNGDLAGIKIETAKEKYPGLYWRSLEWEQPYPNGESPERFFNRVRNAWRSFKQSEGTKPGNTLLVTHGGVIDVILCLENGRPYTNRQVTYRIAHAEIVRAV